MPRHVVLNQYGALETDADRAPQPPGLPCGDEVYRIILEGLGLQNGPDDGQARYDMAYGCITVRGSPYLGSYLSPRSPLRRRAWALFFEPAAPPQVFTRQPCLRRAMCLNPRHMRLGPDRPYSVRSACRACAGTGDTSGGLDGDVLPRPAEAGRP